MNKLRKAKKIIRQNIEYGDCGLLDHYNLLYDQVCTIYNKNGLTINICDRWSYFEVVGLNDDEFRKLEYYYNHLISLQQD